MRETTSVYAFDGDIYSSAFFHTTTHDDKDDLPSAYNDQVDIPEHSNSIPSTFTDTCTSRPKISAVKRKYNQQHTPHRHEHYVWKCVMKILFQF